MNPNWIPIRYRDFYDVPRMVVVQFGEAHYLFESAFDQEADDYSDWYTIYRLSSDGVDALEEPSWDELPKFGDVIGRAAVSDVHFDPSKQRSLDAAIFRQLDTVE